MMEWSNEKESVAERVGSSVVSRNCALNWMKSIIKAFGSLHLSCDTHTQHTHMRRRHPNLEHKSIVENEIWNILKWSAGFKYAVRLCVCFANMAPKEEQKRNQDTVRMDKQQKKLCEWKSVCLCLCEHINNKLSGAHCGFAFATKMKWNHPTEREKCGCVHACVRAWLCVCALSKSTIADSYMCGCPCIAYGSAIAHKQAIVVSIICVGPSLLLLLLSFSAWVRSFGFICWCWQLMLLLFVHKKVNADVDIIIGQHECHSIFHFVPLKVFDFSFSQRHKSEPKLSNGWCSHLYTSAPGILSFFLFVTLWILRRTHLVYHIFNFHKHTSFVPKWTKKCLEILFANVK